MMKLLAALLLLGSLVHALPPASPSAKAPVGILVMAHGGKEAWEAGLLDALKDLSRRAALEVAFGMATPPTIQEAVKRLEKRGARRIAVVRLFVSGDSFLTETRQILGLEPGAPPRPKEATGEGHAHAHHHDHGAGSLWRVESSAEFAMSRAGLMDSRQMGKVLAKRALGLSREPRRESVLILAHGPEDDEENQRWIERISALAADISAAAPFREVRVETLREDWPEKRQEAERRIRDFAARGAKDGKVIVIPFRVHGFGPYKQVLDRLDYVADEQGLLPDTAVADWIAEQAKGLAKGKNWPDPLTEPGARTGSRP